MNLTGEQKKTILAAFLGWMLDAFDFFLLTFLLKDIAKEFGVEMLGGRLRAVPDAGDAVRRRLHLRPPRRPVGPQAGADARHPLLFDPRRARRLLAQPHGCSWCCARCSASPWAANGASAVRWRWSRSRRRRAGMVSGILQCGYPTGFLLAAVAYWPALRPHVRRLHDRLAGDVPAQRPAGLRRAVHPQRRARIAGVRGVEGAREAPPVGDDLRAQGAGRLHGRADDVLQSVQPRHAGPLSDLPAEAAQFRSRRR